MYSYETPLCKECKSKGKQEHQNYAHSATTDLHILIIVTKKNIKEALR